jgi:hypothetical protein
MVLPKNVSTPPTYFPSSLPSNLPSSIPTSPPTTIHQLPIIFPTNTPSISLSPPIVVLSPNPTPSTINTFPPNLPGTVPPSFLPSTIKPYRSTRIPTFIPSTSVPSSKKPTINPTRFPSLSPSITVTIAPKTTKPIIPPSFRPSRRPTTLLPTAIPSEFPTDAPASTYLLLDSIDSPGTYQLPNQEKNKISITGSGNIFIQGNHGSKWYTIIPDKNVIEILDFDNNYDILDLSQFSIKQFSSINDLTYSTNPLTIYLSARQSIILSSHNSFDLQETNFYFPSSSLSSSSSNTQKGVLNGGFTVDSSFIISISVLLACGLFVTCIVCVPGVTS